MANGRIQSPPISKSHPPLLQRKPSFGKRIYQPLPGHLTPDALPKIHEAIQSSGRQLASGTRTMMESRFGYDFSRVRVHTNRQAARSAQAYGARAYTVGPNIIFNKGQYTPQTVPGRRLIAHELTHTVQQDSISGNGSLRPAAMQAANSTAECEAHAVSNKVIRGHSIPPIRQKQSVPVIQRVPFLEQLARFFGGGTFSDQELQDYLTFLDENSRIEGHFDSDNKARVVVERWVRGDSLFILTSRRKQLLIKEMIDGFTGDDDENAILALLRGATDTELAGILSEVGRSTLESNFHGDERRQLDALLQTRTGQRGQQPADSAETFDSDTILQLQRRFTSNSQEANRLNCILIIRELAPQLFAQDPELASTVATRLGQLRGRRLKMTEVGRVMSDLGLVNDSRRILFNNGNGNDEPTAMEGSAWEAIMEMVGDTQGWHVFGMAVFDGYHSVTVLVNRRADGARLYWADQWRIDPGDDFHEEEGSVSGFRRYGKAGFDQFLTDYTTSRWRQVFEQRGRRYSTTLHIWKFRSRLERNGEQQ